MQSEFTLYGTLTSTATSRVRLTLAEAGFEQYEFRPLEIKSNEHKVGIVNKAPGANQFG